jgi:hypothetical protein
VSDLELLFLVLVCLYGWECACWLRPGSNAFITWLGKQWRSFDGSPIGNQHGSFILAPPLPPLGNIVIANPPPLFLSSEGVASGGFTGSAGKFVIRRCRFDDIKTVESRGRKLLLNDEIFLKAASVGLAVYLAESIRSLGKISTTERSAAIEKILRGTFDAKAVKERWEKFEQQTTSLRWLVNALFIYVFGLIPMAIWRFGLKMSWMSLLAGLLMLTVSVAIFFRRAHKTFYPKAEDDRFTHFLTIMLSPVTAIRALDILSRPLMETFHPLAVAAVFCPAEKLRQLAVSVWREIRFPSVPGNGAAASPADAEAHAMFHKTVENFLKRNKIDPDELLRPPQPLDDTCVAYCPRCLSQFIKREGGCPDCGGVALQLFKKSSSVESGLRA